MLDDMLLQGDPLVNISYKREHRGSDFNQIDSEMYKKKLLALYTIQQLYCGFIYNG